MTSTGMRLLGARRIPRRSRLKARVPGDDLATPLDSQIGERSKLSKLPWTISYVAFLAYTLSIVTYALPIASVAMVVAIVGVLFSPRTVRVPAFLWLFAALLAWALVGYGTTSYPVPVGEALIVGGKLWLIAFVATNVLRHPAQLRFYLVFFILCFATYPARGTIFNFFMGYTLVGRAIWNFIYSNPNDLAALTFLPLAIAIALWTTEKWGWFKVGALASLGVLPLLILVTQSRGAFIALAIVGLFLLMRERRRGRVLVAVASLCILAFFVVPQSAWQRFSGLRSLTRVETIAEADPEGSAEGRFNIWKVTLLMTADHPVTGVGLGAFPSEYVRYSPLVPNASGGMRDAHSTYLWLAASTGLPGLMVFLAIVGAVLHRAERVRKKLTSMAPRNAALLHYLELGLIAYLLAGIFGSFALLSFLYLHLALIWSTSEIFLREQNRVAKAPQT